MIDKIKKWFSRSETPQKNIRKTQLDAIKRAYQASQPDSNFKLIPKSLSPNSNTQSATEKIRDQARFLDENHDLTIGVLDTLVSKIIGKSIIVTPTVKTLSGELDDDVNKQIKDLWSKFEERPEVSGRLSMSECDRILCRTWLRDGEALKRDIYGNVSGVDHATDVPYSIQLIEPDYLSFQKNEKSGANNIIQSIEINRWGKPVKYHILKENPYEMLPYQSMGQTDTFPVSAQDINHIVFSRRIAQVRGVSILHGVIRRMESIKDYEESEEIAARVAANMTGFIKKDIELGGGATETDDREMEMSAGMIFELEVGEDVGTISSDRPNTGLLDFRNAMLRGVASGTMTNFSSISGYYDGTYSAQRQELVESKTNYDVLRDTYVTTIKRPTYNRFVEFGLTFGVIQPSENTDLNTLLSVDIAGIPLAWIDPKKEMDAFSQAKNEKFNSRHAIIRAMGLDPVEVDAEIENDSMQKEDKETENQLKMDEENDKKEEEKDEE